MPIGTDRSALQFAGRGRKLTEDLYFCDRHQITLLFHEDADRLAKNRERIGRMKAAFWRVQEALNNDFIVLKGFANWDNYWPDPERRIQYDLDLFCPEPIAVRNTLIKLGYEETEQRSRIDHLPPL